MGNKYGENAIYSPLEREAKLKLVNIYNDFREIVLNNKNYALGEARELLDSLSPDEARKIFEKFNTLEGALPGDLENEYIKLVYSSLNVREKMAGGETLYQALAEIAQEVKEAKVILNNDLVQAQVKSLTKELESDKA